MIRKIKPSDRDTFLKLSGMLYASDAVERQIPESNREAAFDELMRSNDYLDGVILESGGKIAGYGLTSKMYSQEAGGFVLWLEELFILPEYRSKGLGGEFFRYAEGIPGIVRTRLEVEGKNARAISLYKRLGYKEGPYMQMMKILRA